MDLTSKIKKALELLEKFNKWNHKYVFFSGGKDSLVCLDLASKAWDNFTVIYCEVTGNTHPICTKYVKKVVNEYNVNLVHIKQEKYEFFDRLEKWGYPPILNGYTLRWCLNHFKCRPIANFTKGQGVGVAGIKPSDSTRRFYILNGKFLPAVVDPSPRSTRWAYYSIKPLYWFTKEDVWRYISMNNLEINPLYEYIGFSGNCMICPGMNKNKFVAVMEKCPEFFNKWVKVHKKLREAYLKSKSKSINNAFIKFDKWYNIYCKNKKLIDYEVVAYGERCN